MKGSFFNKKLFLFFTCLAISFLAGLFVNFKIGDNPITREMVQQAGNLIGLDFTQSEIDSMLPDLENARENYLENRKTVLPNAVAPALVFNPLPVGFSIEGEQKEVRFSDIGEVHLPEDPEALAFYTVRQQAELLRTQQITSVELTRFFLKRLKKYDEKLHFVITYTEDLAMEQARRADAEIKAGKYRGLLHGIPYGAKDLLAVKNYKTTWGAAPYKDQKFDEDAEVIQRLEAAGAVLVAKMTMGALAWGDVWFGGKTRNPWDPEKGSSGSSAGSASAVAAGCLPFALGTETLGSIVSPSTVCGATGLRPTFGRVPRTGAMALSWSMDKIGPLCRSVEDCAIVFNALFGPDGKDLSVVDAPFNYDANFAIKKLRVGYLKSDFEGKYPFKKQDSLTLLKLKELGVELVPVELPKSPSLSFVLEAEAAAAFDELTRSGKDDLLVRQIRNAWPNVFRAARFIPAVEYIQANRLRNKLIQDMNQLMQGIDLYVNPSWASRSLGITNLTGHPCVVLPNGFKDGLPTSITFTGKLFGEAELLRFAKFYQDATKFHLDHPVLE